MKKLCVILIMFFITLIVIGIIYYFKDKRIYHLNLPHIGGISKITMKQNTDSVAITNIYEMNEILDTLNGEKRITEKVSVHASPINISDKIKLDFYLDENKGSTVYVYRKFDKYFIEQPYNGIYRISPYEYNSIEKFVS